LEFHTDKTKKVTASEHDDRILLKLYKMEWFNVMGETIKKQNKRVTKELRIIDQLGFNAYFLITWDIIRYAISQGFFFHIGRVAGPNSIVVLFACYRRGSYYYLTFILKDF